MKKYPWWKKLFPMFLLCLLKAIELLKLPRNYDTLDDWLNIDKKKCLIVADVIGCKNVKSLIEQQEKNMEYRKKFTNSFKDWVENLSKIERHSDVIDKISNEYALKKLCHRKYTGKDAGIICYCK